MSENAGTAIIEAGPVVMVMLVKGRACGHVNGGCVVVVATRTHAASFARTVGQKRVNLT